MMNNPLHALVLEKGGRALGAPPVIPGRQRRRTGALTTPLEDHYGD